MLGVAVATLSFGQLISLHETDNAYDLHMSRIMEADQDLQNEVLFYTSGYNAENGRTMHWVDNKPMNTNPSASYITPLESRAYFARKVDKMYEEVPIVETWMITPFESSLEDSELRLEDWMIESFIKEFYEEAQEIEPWMTSDWI